LTTALSISAFVSSVPVALFLLSGLAIYLQEQSGNSVFQSWAIVYFLAGLFFYLVKLFLDYDLRYRAMDKL